MKSKKYFQIELLEEHERVNLYSIRFHGNEFTEFESFLYQFHKQPAYEREVKRIVYWFDKITNEGAQERFFRPESKMYDGVCAIPIEFSSLRLYCLRLSSEILIIGNGGLKNKRTYNEIPHLQHSVDVLSKLDYLIKKRLKEGKTCIAGKLLDGNLRFYL